MTVKGEQGPSTICVIEPAEASYEHLGVRVGQILGLARDEAADVRLRAATDAKAHREEVEAGAAAQRKDADTFLQFLLSEPIQKESLNHGFRPANPSVPIKFADSPFVKYADYGIKVDLPKICDPPHGEVVNNLLQSWQRSQGNR